MHVYSYQWIEVAGELIGILVRSEPSISFGDRWLIS